MTSGPSKGPEPPATGSARRSRATPTRLMLRNWAGDVRWPAGPHRSGPAARTTVAAAVRASQLPIRVLGAGHSFTPLAATDHVTVQLDDLAGLVAVDCERQQATIRAGTRLRELGPLLAAEGLALENQGDVDAQSLGGVLATATHGTGTASAASPAGPWRWTWCWPAATPLTLESPPRRPPVSGARWWRSAAWAWSPGCACSCAPPTGCTRSGAPCLWTGLPGRAPAPGRRAPALRVPLVPPHRPGAHQDPGFRLARRQRSPRGSAIGCAPGWPTWRWTDAGLLAGLPGGPGVPRRRTPALNRFCARTSGQGSWRGPAHRISPSPRLVRFQEMEYALPAERGPDCLREYPGAPRPRAAAGHLSARVPPRRRRRPVAVAVLTAATAPPSRCTCTGGQDHRPLFQAVEAIFQNHAGRPHPGKKSAPDLRYLRRLNIPKWDTFQTLRRGAVFRRGDS